MAKTDMERVHDLEQFLDFKKRIEHFSNIKEK